MQRPDSPLKRHVRSSSIRSKGSIPWGKIGLSVVIVGAVIAWMIYAQSDRKTKEREEAFRKLEQEIQEFEAGSSKRNEELKERLKKFDESSLAELKKLGVAPEDADSAWVAGYRKRQELMWKYKCADCFLGRKLYRSEVTGDRTRFGDCDHCKGHGVLLYGLDIETQDQLLMAVEEMRSTNRKIIQSGTTAEGRPRNCTDCNGTGVLSNPPAGARSAECPKCAFRD